MTALAHLRNEGVSGSANPGALGQFVLGREVSRWKVTVTRWSPNANKGAG